MHTHTANHTRVSERNRKKTKKRMKERKQVSKVRGDRTWAWTEHCTVRTHSDRIRFNWEKAEKAEKKHRRLKHIAYMLCVLDEFLKSWNWLHTHFQWNACTLHICNGFATGWAYTHIFNHLHLVLVDAKGRAKRTKKARKTPKNCFGDNIVDHSICSIHHIKRHR